MQSTQLPLLIELLNFSQDEGGLSKNGSGPSEFLALGVFHRLSVLLQHSVDNKSQTLDETNIYYQPQCKG